MQTTDESRVGPVSAAREAPGRHGESDAAPSPSEPATPGPDETRPREIGGRDGPEPTRFGDWEKAGRCIDF